MKGQYGQECNITACQKPNSAFWLNRLNNQYYCEDCARRLNNDEFNKRDCLRLLGDIQMCVEVNTGYEEKERGISINEGLPQLVQNIIDSTLTQYHELTTPLSGREKRRERRKQNRKK
jgi:hypothetical protein